MRCGTTTCAVGPIVTTCFDAWLSAAAMISLSRRICDPSTLASRAHLWMAMCHENWQFNPFWLQQFAALRQVDHHLVRC
jgi:hypothetical protein